MDEIETERNNRLLQTNQLLNCDENRSDFKSYDASLNDISYSIVQVLQWNQSSTEIVSYRIFRDISLAIFLEQRPTFRRFKWSETSTVYCRMSVMWCATYGGHLHFVELSDSWSYVAAKRLDNDKATLVVRQAQFASSTVLHCANRLSRIHSERRRLVAVLLWQLYTTS